MATSKSSNQKSGASIAKRAKISKAQRNMFIAIALASVVFGMTIVGVIYLGRVIKFNSIVAAKMTEANKGISDVQNNLLTISNDIYEMSKNEKLEVVARKRSDICKASEELDGFEYSLTNLGLARTCTSLRVIPDAMPSVFNKEATLASVNQLLYWSNNGQRVQFESLSGEDNGDIPSRILNAFSQNAGTDSETGNIINAIEADINLADTPDKIHGALDAIENSVRPYDIVSFNINWVGGNAVSVSNSKIELNASYISYYTGRRGIEVKKQTYCADKESKKCPSDGKEAK